jgi:hypothetical protein
VYRFERGKSITFYWYDEGQLTKSCKIEEKEGEVDGKCANGRAEWLYELTGVSSV